MTVVQILWPDPKLVTLILGSNLDTGLTIQMCYVTVIQYTVHFGFAVYYFG